MDVHTETRDESLTRLTTEWREAKANEQAATAHRISIESQIYEMTQTELPEKGTTTFDSGMKITTGFSEDWDQTALSEAYNQWAGEVPFPFNGVWKPDGKAISYLRENAPDLYKQIQGALTIKPKKPAFSVKGEKE